MVASYCNFFCGTDRRLTGTLVCQSEVSLGIAPPILYTPFIPPWLVSLFETVVLLLMTERLFSLIEASPGKVNARTSVKICVSLGNIATLMLPHISIENEYSAQRMS